MFVVTELWQFASARQMRARLGCAQRRRILDKAVHVGHHLRFEHGVVKPMLVSNLSLSIFLPIYSLHNTIAFGKARVFTHRSYLLIHSHLQIAAGLAFDISHDAFATSSAAVASTIQLLSRSLLVRHDH
jgi:hypothetical protein